MIQIRDLRILEVENEAGDLPKILMYPNFDPVYMRFSVQKLIVIFNLTFDCFLWLYDINAFIKSLKYRVSHSDMDFFKWLWGVGRLRILMIYLWLHGHESYPFVFHQPLFKKVASAGLNSLRQKGYQILVKNWIFDDPFHKKEPLLVILVPRMIQPSGSLIFLLLGMTRPSERGSFW